MNLRSLESIPPEEEGTCGNWTFHEWAEAFSTNDLARAYGPWHIAVARIQHGGRGRFNRPWIAAEGGLWASFNVPLNLDAPTHVNWGHLPLMAGLALLNMLCTMGIQEARLRWPNDLLIGKAKLAGILVERPAAEMAVIGIGLNVHNDIASIAAEIKDPPARLADLIPSCPPVRTIMATLAEHLEELFKTFSLNGLSTLHTDLERAWQGARPVCVHLDEKTISGRFTGIDAQGNPMLVLCNGSTCTIPAHLINRLIETQA